jgi:hypothetical protein
LIDHLLAKASAISILVIEPNNFSPPAFAVILISIAFKASANACASATTLALCALFVLSSQLILSLQNCS